MDETVDMFTENARRKGLELACLVHKDVPAVLSGDRAHLRQILINLVGNIGVTSAPNLAPTFWFTVRLQKETSATIPLSTEAVLPTGLIIGRADEIACQPIPPIPQVPDNL